MQLFSQGVALREIPSSIIRDRLTDGQDKQGLESLVGLLRRCNTPGREVLRERAGVKVDR